MLQNERAHAIEVIAAATRREDIDHLQQYLQHPHLEIRMKALDAICQIVWFLSDREQALEAKRISAHRSGPCVVHLKLGAACASYARRLMSRGSPREEVNNANIATALSNVAAISSRPDKKGQDG